MTWIKAAQIYLIEKRLEGRSDFSIKSVLTPTDQPTKLIFVIDVLESNPVIVTCAVIAGVIVTMGIVYKLTFEKSFLLVAEAVSSPAGQVGIAGMGIGLAAAGVVALLALLPKK